MIDPEHPISRLLAEYQSAPPGSIVASLSNAATSVDAKDMVLRLIDYDHTTLMPFCVLVPGSREEQPVPVDGSMAGRAFQTGAVVATERETGWRVWVPIQERDNKLGVLEMTLCVFDEQVDAFCQELGNAAAYLLIASAHYTDLPHVLRRRQDMDLAAEMQWSLLPPLSYSSAGTTLAGLLEPAYEVGGDCFDYAANDTRLDVGVFDSMGHGLTSAVLAALLIGAYRHSRRSGQDLPQIATSVDAAARTFPGPPTFGTALFATLELPTGYLRWLTCGHPQPIIVRQGSTLPALDIQSGVPLGFGMLGPIVGTLTEIALEPGDGILLYTDGVTEARDPDGTAFGESRLRDLLAREHHAGGPPQEIIRRLVRSALDHSQVRLRDDATMVYIRWNHDAAQQART